MSGVEANTAIHNEVETPAAAHNSTLTEQAEPQVSTSDEESKVETKPDAVALTPAGDPGSKKCTMCQKPRNVLIRCQIDDTGKWNFLCPGKCWRLASDGGHVDGGRNNTYKSRDGSWRSVTGGQIEGRPQYHYRYGGTWKNKHQMVSGKIKGKAKKENQDPSTRAVPEGDDVPEEMKAKAKHTARFIGRPDMRTGKGTRNNNKEMDDRILREVDVKDLDEEQDITSQIGDSEDEDEQRLGHEGHEEEYEYHEEDGNKSDKRTIEQDGVSIDFENRPS